MGTDDPQQRLERALELLALKPAECAREFEQIYALAKGANNILLAQHALELERVAVSMFGNAEDVLRVLERCAAEFPTSQNFEWLARELHSRAEWVRATEAYDTALRLTTSAGQRRAITFNAERCRQHQSPNVPPREYPTSSDVEVQLVIDFAARCCELGWQAHALRALDVAIASRPSDPALQQMRMRVAMDNE